MANDIKATHLYVKI